MDEMLQVGIVSSTHGLKGEVKVFPTTDDVNRFKKLKQVVVVHKDREEVLEIQSVKFFKKFVILKFKGIDDINDVVSYKTKSLFVTREFAVKCEKDEYFIADLIGVDVYNEEDEKVGVIEDVMQTGANDVYIITLEDGSERLVPAIKDCILQVDIRARKMVVHFMEEC